MARAVVRNLRISPRKVRPLLNLVRGKAVADALAVLNFTPRAGSKPLMKLINSAIANAIDREKADVDKLVISKLFADNGPTMRRFRARAMGRATRVKKRSTHVTVELSTK
ncbi:MAG TPA: 50S ribosomal protein L22 [Myxococcota bacterium]|jgi:large subunit ribosomal protein L22|nr:50S ribosomal protein L22 [Myxococcota bacterium]